MSTPQSTTYNYSRSASSGRWALPSAAVFVAAALFSVLWPAIDMRWHGHFDCEKLIEPTLDRLREKSHLKAYLEDQSYTYKDAEGQDKTFTETGTVKCSCDGRRKFVLTGKVVNDSIRQEFSDAVSEVLGSDKVDNQIEYLNEDAIRQIQALQSANGHELNYTVTDRGVIVLTGDLPSPEGGQKLESLVASIRGVRGVVNRLGEKLHAQNVLVMRNIYFDFNKYEIRQESMAALEEAAQVIEDYLMRNPDGVVTVEGHTDGIQSAQKNMILSQRRAEAVKNALEARGIPAAKLVAVGKGMSERLVKPDNTPEERAENRRIEFHFGDKK